MAIETKVSVRLAAEGGRKTERDIEGVGGAIVNLGVHVKSTFSEMNAALGIASKGLDALKGVVDGFVFKPLTIAADFERNFALIKTLGAQLPVDLEQSLLDLARRVPQTAADITKAAYDAISAGVDPQQIPRFLEAASKAAVGGQSTLTEATRALVTATNAYKVQGLDAARAADVLFATVQKGITNFRELGAAQGSSLGPAAALGASFEEMNAAVATITKVVPSAAEAFTRVDALIKGVTKPTEQAKKEFQRLGIGFGVTNLQAKGLAGVLDEIRKKTGGSAAALSALAGRNKEVLEGLMLLNNDFDGFRENLDYITKASGQTEMAFKLLDETTAGTADRLKAEFEAVLLEIGKEVLPLAIEALRELQRQLSGPEGRDMIEAIKTIAKAMMDFALFVISSIDDVVNAFKWLGDTVSDAASGMVLSFGMAAKEMSLSGVLSESTKALRAFNEETARTTSKTMSLGEALRVAYDTDALVKSQEQLLALAQVQQQLQVAELAATKAMAQTKRAGTASELAAAALEQAKALEALQKAQKAGLETLATIRPKAVAKSNNVAVVTDPDPDPPRSRGPDRGKMAAEALYNAYVEEQRALDAIAQNAADARRTLMADEFSRTIADIQAHYAEQIALAEQHGADTTLLLRARDKLIADTEKTRDDARLQREQATAERAAALIADQTSRELTLLDLRYAEERRLYADNATMLAVIDAEYQSKRVALREEGEARARAAATAEFQRQVQDTGTLANNVDNALGALQALMGTSQAFEKLQMVARAAKYGADAAGYVADATAAFAAGNPLAGAGFIAASLAAGAAAVRYGAGAAGLIGPGGGGRRGGGGATPNLNRRDLGPRNSRQEAPREVYVNLTAGDGRPLTRFEAREVALGMRAVFNEGGLAL